MRASDMMDTLTADQILALRAHQASGLFGADPKGTFKELARRWHPDTSSHPEAAEVFRHIVTLRDAATKGAGQIQIVSKRGKETIFLEPVAETDTGRRWVGHKICAWSFEKEKDLEFVFARNLAALPFADAKMKEQMRTAFPKRWRRVTHDDAPMILFPIDGGAILQDWIGVHGPFPAVHAAWLGSGLLNIASYASWSGWHLPAIGLDTVAIAPDTHHVMLRAGWEAAAPAGERPVVASRRTIGLCPAIKAPGQPLPETLTIDIVRLTLREALGDPSGLTLKDRGVPAPMVDWINAPSHRNGAWDYARWHRALQSAFGARRFVEWNRRVADVYPNF